VTTDLTATLPRERTDAIALEFTDVTKTFADGTHALASTSFTVAPGQFVSVVGPSGCGKSTLLRIASGLDAPTTGTVSVDRNSLGYVFQDPTLLQWRTVRRNVELFAELEGLDRAERARRVTDNVRLVGLEGFEDKYPKQLSGGMKMRASLARSLLMEPAMFLFDEPFGALDEITRADMRYLLLELWQRTGTTVVFVTHSIPEAVFLSDRVVVMAARPGRIAAVEPITLGRPRVPAMEDAPEFHEHVRVLRAQLQDHHS